MDHLKNWGIYKSISRAFAPAFNWIEKAIEKDVLDNGKIQIQEGITAIIDSYQPKTAREGMFEAHRKNMDIQLLVEGNEYIYWSDHISKGEHTPYSPEKDIEFYKVDLKTTENTRLLVKKATFVILWPGEWHMPCISIHEKKPGKEVKKIVVKIQKHVL
ncbi:MAG: YhcH/YjgK/YiaL family protein [Promethearchaeota archaeon]